MNTHPQYWQARTPLRVRVLGLLFLSMVLWLVGLLWLHWGQSPLVYGGVALVVLICTSYTFWKSVSTTQASIQTQMLCFDELSGDFSLMDAANNPVDLRILCVWQSFFAISLQVKITHNNEIKQLTFWRSALSASCWRKLHIHLWRYQLQCQFADLKGN